MADTGIPQRPQDSATPVSARESYAKLNANTSGSHHRGQTSTEAQAALDEIDRLRRWKREAIEAQKDWERCFDSLPPSRRQRSIGEFKSAVVYRFIVELTGLMR